MINYRTREMEKALKKAAAQFPAVIVTGPRQSGKTTLLKHVFLKNHKYVTMDKPDVRLMAEKEPGLFFKEHKPPLMIDEIQYVPGLFSYLKVMIDEKRTKAGQFILTGSQVFSLMAGVSESLAGRIAVLRLLPFSLEERALPKDRTGIAAIKKAVLRGGFPEVVVRSKLDLDMWFSGYLQTYLERDVRQLRQIGDIGDFQRFLELMSVFNGQILNLSNVSRDLGVAVNTAKAWLSVLEATGQIAVIKPFFLNKGKRIIKSPKVYFLDTGLLCYLAGITSEEQVFKGPLSGQMLETLVLGEIMKSFCNRGKMPRIYWWRTSNGEEVDLVLEAKGRLIPVEVKMTSRVDMNKAKGLISFCKLFADRIDKGYLVYLGDDRFRLAEKIEALPMFDFLDTLPGM